MPQPELNRRDLLKLALAGAASGLMPLGAGPAEAARPPSHPVPRLGPREFPRDFFFGTATASYQVEGAAAEDGRGPSIWDTFSHTAGKVKHGDTGDVADDQYHRYKEDVQLMRRLGAKAYRFSTSWSRILPQGTGQVNQAGLDYYRRLVDELLAHDITPYMTLFHWDLPQALQDRWLGWQSRETAEAFGDFAAVVARALGDRVKHIFTTNEISCFTDNSHADGEHAPGLKLDARRRNQVRHHGVLAHGLAVQAVRAHAPRDVRVGIAENPNAVVPVMETPEHIAAARKAMRLVNAPFLTAIMEGRYAPEYLRQEGADAPRFTAEDMKAIGSRLDFVGLNVYAPTYVRAAANEPGFVVVDDPPSAPRMDVEWLKVGPQIAYWAPRLLHELWRMPTVISENGCCCTDAVVDGEVYDTDRVMYLREHFLQAQRAVSEGIPLKGYFVWSLLDNFEWAEGFAKRFGIVHVDYATQKRTPKLSATYFREVAASRKVL
jgi:beta-glucosidase